MGFKDFIKKQFIDILQWTETDDDVLAWRFPTADMEIQYGGSLTVRESQVAVFINEGQVADVFAPGMHKLTTNTLPVLTYLKNWDKLFESPFKSEVYFLSTRARLGRKWGTPQAITVRDKDFGAIQVRAFGQYTWHIADAKKFYLGVSGTRETYRVGDIEEQLRGVIVAALAGGVGASGVPFLDLAANQADLTNKIREKAQSSFEQLGLALDDFQLMSLTLPEALQEALDKRIRVSMLGGTDGYTRIQAADAIPLAAANEGGGMAGMAAQLAVGLGMGQVMQTAMTPAMASAATAAPGAEAPLDPVAKLTQLKALLAAGLVTQAEFDAARAAVLSKITG